jgi:hypothetical protein
MVARHSGKQKYHDQGHSPVRLMGFETVIDELRIEPQEGS